MRRAYRHFPPGVSGTLLIAATKRSFSSSLVVTDVVHCLKVQDREVGVRSCNNTSGWIKKAVPWRAPYDWNLPVRFII